MFNKVLEDIVMPVLRYGVELFFQVVDSLGARGFLFGAFIILTITRFLLLPLISGKVIQRGGDRIVDGDYMPEATGTADGINWQEHMGYYLEDK